MKDGDKGRWRKEEMKIKEVKLFMLEEKEEIERRIEVGRKRERW